jgi:hypothetical protein
MIMRRAWRPPDPRRSNMRPGWPITGASRAAAHWRGRSIATLVAAGQQSRGLGAHRSMAAEPRQPSADEEIAAPKSLGSWA